LSFAFFPINGVSLRLPRSTGFPARSPPGVSKDTVRGVFGAVLGCSLPPRSVPRKTPFVLICLFFQDFYFLSFKPDSSSASNPPSPILVVFPDSFSFHISPFPAAFFRTFINGQPFPTLPAFRVLGVCFFFFWATIPFVAAFPCLPFFLSFSPRCTAIWPSSNPTLVYLLPPPTQHHMGVNPALSSPLRFPLLPPPLLFPVQMASFSPYSKVRFSCSLVTVHKPPCHF